MLALSIIRRFTLIVCSVTLGILVQSDVGRAETYPARIIRIVVGSDASSPIGIVTRLIAADLTEQEGWQLVVENKPGASYAISAVEVLRQPADGYTIWGIGFPAAASRALLSGTSFRLDADFEPLIKLTTSYNVLVVHPSVPATSLIDLVAHLKRNPDKLTFSSGGVGSPAHLIGELFKLEAGVRAAHVPYPGGMTKAVTDLINGTNQYQFITTLPVLELIASSHLRALAITAPRRMAVLPNVPTVVEQGYPELVVEDWTGFALKDGTPPEIVTRLNNAVARALASHNVATVLAKLGAEPAGGTPGEFGDLLRGQVSLWSEVVTRAGIRTR